MRFLAVKQCLKHLPKLPLSALLFYLLLVLFWKLGVIPNPAGILEILEGLYENYGLPGLFAASFLEGIVYFGLYFPGSFVVALSVILSDGSFASLLAISCTVGAALTLTSCIDYLLGRRILRNSLNKKILKEERRVLSKGLFFSILHPNALAFYFFNAGIQGHSFWKVLMVPILIIPYGLFLGLFLFSIKDSIKRALESPYLMVTYLLVWFFVALLIDVWKKAKAN